VPRVGRRRFSWIDGFQLERPTARRRSNDRAD
jgi:hypothetical protein